MCIVGSRQGLHRLTAVHGREVPAYEVMYNLDFSSDSFCNWNQWRQESDDETFDFDLFIWGMVNQDSYLRACFL